MTPAELVARGESRAVCGILPPSGFGSYHRRNLPELRDECGSRAELIFEPRRCPLFELSGGLWPSRGEGWVDPAGVAVRAEGRSPEARAEDRKSTRLNSSHSQISYAVFC